MRMSYQEGFALLFLKWLLSGMLEGLRSRKNRFHFVITGSLTLLFKNFIYI